MTINDSVLQSSEKIIFALRELYSSYGYVPYRMSKFEEYDLYAKNKDFLVSDNVITFTDIGGKLMALKPDVTLSIIKNSADEPSKTEKVFYNENVYRVSKGSGSYKELMQSGVECFGKVGITEICEVVTLAARCLELLSEDAVLVISDLDIISGIVDLMGLSSDKRAKLYAAIGEKNLHETEKLISECRDKNAVKTLISLLSMHKGVKEALPELKAVLGETAFSDNLCEILGALAKSPYADKIIIDFSVVGDTNYYNGIVLKGFLRDVPTEVLSGGQYDRLMRKLGRSSNAIGFAVYADALERIDLFERAEKSEGGDYINVALPKGRLGEKVYDMFERAGYPCDGILEPNRKLIFENPGKKVRYFWVKPSDVAIYVERGAADIGVAGKDILLEYEPDIYELLDLKKGKCRMAVASKKNFSDDTSNTLRVATKFSNIAKAFYRSKGRDIDIIHLNGSIELAPILGLSDVIVDIVETGTTLKENDLEVVETITPISARLIANKSSFKFKYEEIEKIKEALREITEE